MGFKLLDILLGGYILDVGHMPWRVLFFLLKWETILSLELKLIFQLKFLNLTEKNQKRKQIGIFIMYDTNFSCFQKFYSILIKILFG